LRNGGETNIKKQRGKTVKTKKLAKTKTEIDTILKSPIQYIVLSKV
jgi:hypothetical protein